MRSSRAVQRTRGPSMRFIDETMTETELCITGIECTTPSQLHWGISRPSPKNSSLILPVYPTNPYESSSIILLPMIQTAIPLRLFWRMQRHVAWHALPLHNVSVSMDVSQLPPMAISCRDRARAAIMRQAGTIFVQNHTKTHPLDQISGI